MGVYLFSLIIQPLINELKTSCDLDLNVWFADDGTLIGRLSQLAKATPILEKAVLSVGYHLEVSKSKMWWPTLNQSLCWHPNTSSFDDRVLLKPLPSPQIAEEVTPAHFQPAAGIKLLGAPIGDDAFVQRLLHERMA